MAYVQSRRKAVPPDFPDNKENQPPKKPKKAQPSANDLLKKSKSKHRSARDILAPLPGGISKKAKSPQSDFFKRFSKKRKGSSDDPLRAVPGFFRKLDKDKHQERALDTGYAGMHVHTTMLDLTLTQIPQEPHMRTVRVQLRKQRDTSIAARQNCKLAAWVSI